MQQEVNFELNLKKKGKEKQILAIFQEIKEGYLVESNDILEDLKPLLSQLHESDKKKVVQALNQYFRDHEFVKNGGFWIQNWLDPIKKVVDYKLIYNSDRQNHKYDSILDNMKLIEYRSQNQIPDEVFANLEQLIKLKDKSLLVFDLLDYQLDKKDLSQIEILSILLELFYCNSMFSEDQSKTFEQLIGSLLEKQLYEICYYFDNLKKDDPHNYQTFVQFLQNLQLTMIHETDDNFQTFLKTNQRYKALLMNFSKDILNIRSYLQQFISSLIQTPTEQCQFVQVISYVKNIENINDNLHDLYVQVVFYYWKKYCIKYNLQTDLKIQQESLPNLGGRERKQKFIERFFQKQQSYIQDKIYLFVIHRICYFIEDIDNILSKEMKVKFIDTMTNNMKTYLNLKNKYNFLKMFLKDNSKFQEYWNVIHSLKFYKQEILNQNNQIDLLITNLFWIYNQNLSLFNLINMLISNNKESFLVAVQLIEDKIIEIKIDSHFNEDVNTLKKNLLKIVNALFPQEENNYLLLIKLFENYGSLIRAPMILEANKFINTKLNQNSLSFFAKLGIKFIVIHKVFPAQTLEKLAQQLLNYLMSNNQEMIYECLLSLKSIFTIKTISLSENLQPLSILISKFSPYILGYLVIINKPQNISLTSVKWTIYAMFLFFQQLDLSQYHKVRRCIEQLFKNKCYNFYFVFQCLRNQINFYKLNKFIQLQYYLCNNQENKFLQLSEELFQQDEQLYEQWFTITKPSQVMLSIEYLKIKKIQQYYPKQMEIPLEDFNISLSEYCEQEQKQVLENWIQEMTNAQIFNQIIPLFFNLIKRGESPQEVLILANETLQKNKQLADEIGCFNLKSLFQIFFNNANEELRLILMKFFSKEFPIPFLYQNPIIDNLKSKTELLLLNSNLFYFFDQGYTIINLSLSQNLKTIGKTDLINTIFYGREKFETSDKCKMNQNTIDIMFDFEFNNSRNFIVADVHGSIIFETLIKIIPFFQLWIVQMDSEKEFQQNLDSIRKILKSIDQQFKEELEICFIVRNTEEKELMNKQPIIYEIEGKNISIIYIHNLVANQIDKQFKISQIQNVSKFLFNIIFNHQNRLASRQRQPQQQQNKFLQILEQFSPYYTNNIQQINNHNNLINKIQEKLNLIVNSQDGFYSQDAFPIRRILWNIKKLRQQNYELCLKPQDNKKDIDRNTQLIKDLEQKIDKQDATDLLKLFCEIFNLKHYYIVYLGIVDKIRQFNEKNLIELQKTDFQLNEQFNNLNNELEKLQQDPKKKEIKIQMSQLKQKMVTNKLNISQKNVGIELFWRELISLRKSIYNNLKFDPVQILSQLIKKGESLEFLDGDTLSINTDFLFDLENKIMQNNQKKILVISILGPQSSGKSTILNKIFGCHFWTSIGRCTKGIHLQILQVQNKELFQNRFDQILILDTEGLQNPNQNDPEFDKKIALFVLSISDIIIINVKGEINQQFKSLVEMCIFTLGHLKNGLSMFKQLSWFFNQNDNYKNVEPFKQQIKDLAQNLKLDENYQNQQAEYIDYVDILDIKDNITGLGFASDQKDWGKNGWNQSVNNHTFSREAYKYGIKMIKQFISKLQDKNKSLNNCNQFFQNAQRNWQSIEKLPDLLEFSELIQHQQNLMMKRYFDDLWKTEDITQVGKKLLQDTKFQIANQKQIVFDFYKQILLEKENEIDSIITQITNKIVESMNTFKGENKIQKKIMQKFLKKLETLIKSEEIQNIFYQKFLEYQQKKGYVKIDNFIQTVLNDQNMKEKFQGNDNLIEKEFQQIWEQFLNESKRISEQEYQKMVNIQYKALKSISTQYILNTKNEQEYMTFLRENIIIQNPNDQKNKDYEQIFQLFSKEFQENNQFILIQKIKQNLPYLDIFNQKIKEKIEQSKDYILNMKQFYSQKIKYDVVAKVDIQQYLNNKFESDFQKFIANCDNLNNLKRCYQQFISLLDCLLINYDKKLKEQLDFIISSPSENKQQMMSQSLQELQKSLQFYFNENQKIDLSDKTIGKYFTQIYQNLKVSQITDESWDNNQKFKEEITQKYIIIETHIEIKSSQNFFFESFDYIMQPQIDIPSYFETKFPQQFNTIMINQNGWKKLYQELYDLIKQEIGYSKLTTNHQVYQKNKEDENISSFNPYLVASIISKVENKIKVQYNNQFAQFGVILSDVGERCICYYCILIIWRFLCYSRWNSKNIQQNHQNNYQTELTRCKAEINQDNQKQSSIKATLLTKNIRISSKKSFLARTKNEVLQKMSLTSMSSFEVIRKLDKELLIDVNEKMFQDDKFKQKILLYTTDHKSFINKYTQDLLVQAQNKLLTEYSKEYQQQLCLYLKSIKENALIVFKYLKHQKKEVKTRGYFKEDANSKNQIFYENYLYRLLIQCILGKNNDKIDIIDQQYQEIFDISNYIPIDNAFNINWQLENKQDQQVYNLKSFVETLIEQIDITLSTLDQILFKQHEYQLDVEFDKLKLKMNGCEYTCPCCKRKCDQDYDKDDKHTHQCQNGHQIRAINGILISKTNPSLFTCEEILDDCKLKTLETNQQNTWREVKKRHSNWNFKNQDETKNHQNNSKWRNIWNIGLGKLICSHLEQQFNQEVTFLHKSEFNNDTQKIHYILILDDSSSMQGDKWVKAQSGALHIINCLQNRNQVSVSVIIFNGDARIVVECQKPNQSEMNKLILFKGGNTSFEPPFRLALELIQKNTTFDKISILFYTDGEAGYPSNIIDQFCKLKKQIRKLISIIACSGEQSSQSLELIIEKFQQNMQSGELRNSVQPMDLKKVWTEIVSQNIHSQLA
ncbi:unnamed protein product [Paramecium octaurelia]|uniref:VLIG-type G domain-containing protein n=1 Tax=Paramecium octaurelia TaxID=43137 RepID=A0A8S1WFF8_PAROT|nr:unnamed protein product [Paramecium octaurelia]